MYVDPIFGQSGTEQPVAKASGVTLEALRPFLSLQAAVASGVTSDTDRVTIEMALEKIRRGTYAVDPFGDRETFDSPWKTLRILADKYSSADDGDAFTKRARSKFHIGQKVIEKIGRSTGTVKDITPHGLVEIQTGPGRSTIVASENVEAA